MSDHAKKSRLNRKSYNWTMLFALPAFILGTNLANSFANTANEDLGITSFARLTSLLLVVFIIVWTIKRLHDINKSGWWAFLLLPPATVFFLIYIFIASGNNNENRWGSQPESTKIYGIRFAGIGRVIGIILISVFMLYLTGLYASFLFM